MREEGFVTDLVSWGCLRVCVLRNVDHALLDLRLPPLLFPEVPVYLGHVPLVPDRERVVGREEVLEGSNDACHGMCSCLDSCMDE